jgi:hypothetical protein
MESIRESELEEASIYFQIQHGDPQKRPTQLEENGSRIPQNPRRKSLEKEAMKLGRSKCDRTVEHRLTFGQFERKKIDEILAQQERNIWLDAIPSIGMGAIGLGAVLGGYGILRWAGVTVENLADEVKNWIDKVADKVSDKIVDVLPPTPAEKRIEEIRIRIEEIQARMNEINALLSSSPPPPFAAIQELMAEGKRLSDERDALWAELDDYATGKTRWTEGDSNGSNGSNGGGPGSWNYTPDSIGDGDDGNTPGPPHMGT